MASCFPEGKCHLGGGKGGSTSLKEFSGGLGRDGELAQKEKSPHLESPEVGISVIVIKQTLEWLEVFG